MSLPSSHVYSMSHCHNVVKYYLKINPHSLTLYPFPVILLLMAPKPKKRRARPRKTTLDPPQRRFVKEYVKDGNATQAVLEAYPDIIDPNYAGQKGHRMINNANIQQAVISSIPSKEKQGDNYEDIAKRCQQEKDHGNEIRARDSQCKLGGHFVEKQEVTHKLQILPNEQQEIDAIMAKHKDTIDITPDEVKVIPDEQGKDGL